MSAKELRDLVEAIDQQTARASGPHDLGFVKIAWIESELTNAREELERKHPFKGSFLDGIEPDWKIVECIVGKEEAERKRAEWKAQVS